jgi:aminoglycoside 2''-phosphotransferase
MPVDATSPADIAGFLELIEQEFDIAAGRSRLVSDGVNHDVVIVDERLVFRFPRRRYYETRLRDEIALLEYLAPRVGVPLPDYTYVSADRSFAGYSLLPGRKLLPWIVQGSSPAERRTIAHQIARFLGSLHALPVDEVRRMRVPRSMIYYNFDDLFFESCATELYPRLPRHEIEWIERLALQLGRIDAHVPRRTLVHGDVRPRHILVDDDVTRITGVIDWSERAIADPAVDFVELWRYGTGMVELIYRAYGDDEGDPHFLYRSFQYRRYLALRRLLDSVRFADSRSLGNAYPLPYDRAHRAFTTVCGWTPRLVRGSAPPDASNGLLTRGEVMRLRRPTTRARLQRLVREEIEPVVPAGRSFVLVNKGSALPLSGGRRPIPFPERHGEWAGYPENDRDAVAELERLRAGGAQFVVLPGPMRYWLEAYPGLGEHLSRTAQRIVDNERALIFRLP